MKDIIVFWGTNEKDERILVIVRLRPDDRKIDIWTYLQEILDQEFVEKMFQDWENIAPETFPPGYTHIEREITATELLPENIKAEKTDLIIRAEKEWYFKVLSQQLYTNLKSEIDALHTQVNQLQSYDKGIWDTAKSYWDKILGHIQEQNISRPQASDLRSTINNIFDSMKKLIGSESEQFEAEAKENYEKAAATIQAYFNRLSENKNVQKLFNELKSFQSDIKSLKLTQSNRRDLWKNIDQLFKELKLKQKSSYESRLDNRMEGLQKAIERMQFSLNKDIEELNFQKKRMDSPAAGQLEMQLREAKMQMIEMRLKSKQQKLDDMQKTMENLEKEMGKVQTERNKAEKQLEKIAQDTEETSTNLTDKTAEMKENISNKAEDLAEAGKEKVEDLKNAAAEMKENISDKAEDLAEAGKEKVEDLKDAAAEMKENISNKAEDLAEAGKEKVEDLKDAAAEMKENISNKAEDVADAAEETSKNLQEKGKKIVDNLMDEAEDLMEKASGFFGNIAKKVADTVEDIKDGIEDTIDDLTDDDKSTKDKA
ncbi:MAG: hypothetical protein R2798_07980 [Chitinophagales bacterium]|nr:hypothetical protein [Chitinophagales bacterium]